MGRWENKKEYGTQFRAASIRTEAPQGPKAIQKFLESGIIKGVGKSVAEKLVNKFGELTFDIIENYPDKLLEIEGIGRKTRDKIIEDIALHKDNRDIVVFLRGCGLSASLSQQIFVQFGQDTIRKIKSNPYSLVRDFRGVGFKTADRIASEVGIKLNDMHRVRAGVGYVLVEAANDGNCGLSVQSLIARTTNLLNIRQELVETAISLEVQSGNVILESIDDCDHLYLQLYYTLENRISAQLRSRNAMNVPWNTIVPDKAIEYIESASQTKLSVDQKRAVSMAISTGLIVITGGPGVGKTTIVNAILKILTSKGVKVGLCAPTGMAAKKMSLATGHEASTIHRLLGYDPARHRFIHNKDNPLDFNMLIVDETSMIDVTLMAAFLDAVDRNTALVLIGDIDQLPSVGAGNVLSDIIASGIVPVVRLTEIFRQVAGSRIIQNAAMIRKGMVPELDRRNGLSDFYFIKTNDPLKCQNIIRTLVVDRIPDKFELDPARDVQVLCPMKSSPIGVNAMNSVLQRELVPNRYQKVTSGERTYAVGDKVMQINNDYKKDVFNGDIGFVKAIDHTGKSLKVDFAGRLVEYTSSDTSSLEPAFAITVHKSQGSEYPAIVIPIMLQHRIMLNRRLLYTAVTRGKQLVAIVGQIYALEVAVYNIPISESQQGFHDRISRLKLLLST